MGVIERREAKQKLDKEPPSTVRPFLKRFLGRLGAEIIFAIGFALGLFGLLYLAGMLLGAR
jgi:hypothetical protein